MGTGSESQSSSIDARKLDICVSFLLDPYGVLTVSATCPQRHKAGATVQFEMHSRMALKNSQVSHFKSIETRYMSQSRDHRSDHAFSGVSADDFVSV